MYTIVFTVIVFDKLTTFNLISVTYKLAYSLTLQSGEDSQAASLNLNTNLPDDLRKISINLVNSWDWDWHGYRKINP